MSHRPEISKGSIPETGVRIGLLQQARLAALQEVALSLTSTLRLEEVLQRVAEMAQSQAGAADAYIYLYDQAQDELSLAARYWAPERTYEPPAPRRTGVTYTVARTGRAEFIVNALDYPAYQASPPVQSPGALACLPIVKGGRVLGTLNLGFWQPRDFDRETRDFLDLMSRYAAIAIDNAQLYSASERRAGELSALREISLEISSQLDLRKLSEDVIRRGRELLHAEGGYVFLFDPDRQVLRMFADQGMDPEIIGREIQMGEGFSGRVAQARRAMALEDYHTWQDRAPVFMDVPVGAIVGAPLLWQDRLLGTLGFNMRAGDTRVFSAEDVRLVEQLAAQTAIAVQNARLYADAQRHAEELDRRVKELALVNDVSHHVNRLDLNEVQESALDQVVARFGATYGAIGLYDSVKETITVTAVRPSDEPLLGTVFRVENQTDLKRAIELHRAVVWKDDPNLVSDHPTRNYFRRRGTTKLVLAPLMVKNQVIGFMGLDPGAREPTEDEVSLMQTVANQIALAIENARLYEVALEKARLERELQLARSVQARFLPHGDPQLAGWTIAARWQPAREVSGDFYDFIALPDGRLGLVIGDVTGKGMPSALVMATTRAVIRAAAQTWANPNESQSPGTVLARVNDLLLPDMPPKMFVTCFYAILDRTTGRLQCANAGQDLPFRRGKEGISKVCVTGLPLGLMSGMPYEEIELVLQPGESILFYSDGLVEAHNSQREMFGSSRLVEWLRIRKEGAALIDFLLDELARFTGPNWEQEDDVTLMTLERQEIGDS